MTEEVTAEIWQFLAIQAPFAILIVIYTLVLFRAYERSLDKILTRITEQVGDKIDKLTNTIERFMERQQ